MRAINLSGLIFIFMVQQVLALSNTIINKGDFHVSLIIGQTKSGQDSFIYSLDNSLIHKKENDTTIIQVNEKDQSNSTSFQILHYSNEVLLPNQQGILIRAPGFGSTNPNLSDQVILDNLLLKISKAVEIYGKIDCVYILAQIFQNTYLEKILSWIQVALGQKIMVASVIVVTQAEDYNEKKREARLKYFQETANNYGVQGGVIDYRGKYLEIDSEGVLQIKESQQLIEGDSNKILKQVLSRLSCAYFPQIAIRLVRCSKNLKEEDKLPVIKKILHQEYNHTSLVVGCEGCGKRTLIWNFCKNTNNNYNTTIKNSCQLLNDENILKDKHVFLIQYTNDKLIPGYNGQVVYSKPFVSVKEETSQKDKEKAKSIQKEIKAILPKDGDIDIIYIVQSLIHPTNLVDKYIHALVDLYGKGVESKIIVIGTQGNLFNFQTDNHNTYTLNQQKQLIENNFQNHNIIGFIDFREEYIRNNNLKSAKNDYDIDSIEEIARNLKQNEDKIECPKPENSKGFFQKLFNLFSFSKYSDSIK